MIPTLNNLPYTRLTLESVYRCTADQDYEIVVVDNGSTDGSVSYLRKAPKVRLIESRPNRGFAWACNQGIMVSNGDAVCLLNNDVCLTYGWLGFLRKVLKERPDAGMVGPMSNWVSGPQLDQQAKYDGVDDLMHYARRKQVADCGKGLLFQRLVGFCLLISREVIDRVGLLDERFGLGNFEDDDYCRRAVLEGFSPVIVCEAFVHHFGGRSFLGNGLDYQAIFQKAKQAYEEKWRE